MAAAGVAWDAFTLSALLSTCQAGGKWEQALEWFERAQRTPGEEGRRSVLVPGCWTGCRMLETLAMQGGAGGVCLLAAAVWRAAARPTPLRVTPAVHALCFVRCRPAAQRGALHHADELSAEGWTGGSSRCWLCRDRPEFVVPSLAGATVSCLCPAPHSMPTPMLTGLPPPHMQLLQWERSIEVFKGMERSGIQPDVVAHNAAIAACAKVCSSVRICSAGGVGASGGQQLVDVCRRCGQLLWHGPAQPCTSCGGALLIVMQGGDWEKAWAVFLAMKQASGGSRRLGVPCSTTPGYAAGVWARTLG